MSTIYLLREPLQGDIWGFAVPEGLLVLRLRETYGERYDLALLATKIDQCRRDHPSEPVAIMLCDKDRTIRLLYGDTPMLHAALAKGRSMNSSEI